MYLYSAFYKGLFHKVMPCQWCKIQKLSWCLLLVILYTAVVPKGLWESSKHLWGRRDKRGGAATWSGQLCCCRPGGKCFFKNLPGVTLALWRVQGACDLHKPPNLPGKKTPSCFCCKTRSIFFLFSREVWMLVEGCREGRWRPGFSREDLKCPERTSQIA